MSSIHSDPNFSVICSFLTRYGSLLGFGNISFEQLEKWIDDTRYVNSTLKDLLTRLLKRWKSSANEDRLQQYLVKFCHTYSQIDAWEVEGFGFERCKTETKLRIIKTLLERQFDVNQKFKEKINEIPASELRSQPIGRDLDGRAYWFLVDNDMNIRIYSEEQDDVQSETWQIIVSDRSQLANLITSLEQQKTKKAEKSRSATPSTVDSDVATTPAEDCNLGSDVVKVKEEEEEAVGEKYKFSTATALVKENCVNGIHNLAQMKVKLEPPDVPPMKEESPIGDTTGNGGVDQTDCGLVSSSDIPTLKDFSEKNSESKSVDESACKSTGDNEQSVSVAATGEHESQTEVERKSETAEASDKVAVAEAVQSRKTTVNIDDESQTTNTVHSSSTTESKHTVGSVDEIEAPTDGPKEQQHDADDSRKLDTNAEQLNVTNRELYETPAQKASVKRKRASVDRTLSTSSEDGAGADVAAALTESELSDSPVINSCSQSGGEEPPVKRKREKALKTASERDRTSSRFRNGQSHGSPVKAVTLMNEVAVEQKRDESSRSERCLSPGAVDTVAKTNVACDAEQAASAEVTVTDKELEACSAAEYQHCKETNSAANVVSGCGDQFCANDDARSSVSVTEEERTGICPASGIDNPSLAENKKSDCRDQQTVNAEESNRTVNHTVGDEVNGKVWDKGKAEEVKCKTNAEGQSEDGASSVEQKDAGDTVVTEVRAVLDNVLNALDSQSVDEKVSEINGEDSNEQENGPDVNDKEPCTGVPKKTPQKKPGRRGRKKKGSKVPAAKTAAVTEADAAVVTPKKVGRPRKVKVVEVVQDEPESQQSLQLSEDDIPLIELRRSSRANKGQRKLEQVGEQSKKRSRKEEEKERKHAEKEEKRRKREEKLQQDAALKAKKKKRGKAKSDDEFVPGKKNGKRKGKGRGSKAKHGSGESEEESDGTDEIDELFEPETEEEELHFSESTADEQLESDGSEYVPRGRNAKRAAAIKQKVEEQVIEDNPCVRCGKSDQPEWILLCDRCDAGYHTACLRPPIMVIPEADWFCPLCEHSMLIEKLQEQLTEYDKKAQQNVRLIQRKERLAFVSVNVSNIITSQERRFAAKMKNSDIFDDEGSGEETECQSAGESAEEQQPEEPDVRQSARNSRLRNRPQRRRRYSSASSSETEYSSDERKVVRVERRKKPKRQTSGSESTEDDYVENNGRGRRSCRTRRQISYKFEEFDEMISEAIDGDVKSPESNPGHCGRGKGKDMSNITGFCESSSDKPSANKRKKRNLTQLDSDGDDQDDESEEYQLSDGDEPTSAEDEDDDVINSGESDYSDDWNVSRRRTTRNKSRRSSNRSRRPKRYSDYINDESDEDSDYDESRCQRRSRRCVVERRVNYHEGSNSDTDTNSVEYKPAAPVSRNPVSRLSSRRLKDSDSEYQPSTDGDDQNQSVVQSSITTQNDTHAKSTARHKRLGLSSDDEDSEAVSKKKGRLNRIVSSSGSGSTDNDDDEEEEEEEDQPIPPRDNTKTVAVPNGNSNGGVAEPITNGKSSRDNTAVNCNADSLNNRSFAIVNLLKSSAAPQPSKNCVSDCVVNEQKSNPVAPVADDDSLSGIEDLVDYIAQS